MARFTLWKSDLSPPAGAFKPRVDEVVAEFGGVWLEDDERYDLQLRDGTRVEAWTDEEDGSFEIDLDQPHEGAFEMIHAIADRTACFTTYELGNPARALPSTGQPRLEDEGLVIAPVQLAGRRELIEWMRSQMNAWSPTVSRSSGGPPQRSFFQRLSDVLFGKSI